jgi:hypothetical protein
MSSFPPSSLDNGPGHVQEEKMRRKEENEKERGK